MHHFTALFRKLALGLAACLALAGTAQYVVAADCPPPVQMPTAEQFQKLQAEAVDRGFLWKISKGGHDSWLYGTVHVGKADWIMPGPQVKAALLSSQTIALEMDPLDPEIQKKIASLVTKSAGKIPESLKPRVKKQMDAVCMPEAAMSKIHPAMLMVTLELLSVRPDGLEGDYAVEGMLSGVGHNTGKEVKSMETPELQMQALFGLDGVVKPKMITDALESLESGKGRRIANRLAQAWAQSKIDEMESYASWCDCLNTADERAEMKRMLDDRNPGLADSIDALHRQGNMVFAAVGSLHMVGKIGLPALLKQRGYEVTAIPFNPSIQNQAKATPPATAVQ